MNMTVYRLAVVAASLFALVSPARAQNAAPSDAPRHKPWVTAYYLSGDADTGRLPLEKIDFTVLTHIIDFGVFPAADGTLDPKRTIPEAHSRAIIARAHAAGCKVIVSLASDDGAKNLRSSVSPAYRAVFVKTLVSLVTTRGYDGLDLDYEPLEDADVPNYTALVKDLRTALDAAHPGLLLTAAAASEPALFASLQDQFDQINLMTYDLSGPWQDFKSWYNSNLYGSPTETMENNRPYPSVNDMVQDYVKAGIRKSKLGVGIAFYGYVWSGISGPRQTIKGLAGLTVDDGADYRTIMDKDYPIAQHHWDAVAHAPYLTKDAPLQQDRLFVSYDDARLCAEKIAYARQQGLGGAFIWELGGGYRDSQPEGKKDALLQAIKRAERAPLPAQSAQGR